MKVYQYIKEKARKYKPWIIKIGRQLQLKALWGVDLRDHIQHGQRRRCSADHKH
jgi:hypothetical protein